MTDAIPFKDADARLHAVFSYWSGKKGDRPMPARRDIDPLELGPGILPHLMLVDVEAGPRFKYRLFGTVVSDHFGMDATGRYIDEVMVGQYKDFMLGLYSDVVKMKKPVYSTSIYGPQAERKMSTQRLMLPLSSDGATVDMVLACQFFLHGSPLKTLTVRIAQDKAEPIDNLSLELD